MEVRQGSHKEDFKYYDTARIRKEFLIEDLFRTGEIRMVYSHVDRIIVGGLIATKTGTPLLCGDELRAKYFLERREMGVINIGAEGYVIADGKKYPMSKNDCIYLGRGTKEVVFYSENEQNPAVFYMNSCPAHSAYPTRLISLEQAVKVNLGSKKECNERTINKYILPGNCESCQLVMGMTALKEGSVWNTMPCHTHERRMEVYLYFNMDKNDAVFHLMGSPEETRHIVVRDRQAIISPSYSIHSGCGTSNYTFIWGMCGENQDFDDMDHVNTDELK